MTRRARRLGRIVWCLAITAAAGIAPRATPPARAVEPGLAHARTPASLGLHGEDVSFPAADSARVTGWWFPGPARAPVIVIASRGSGTMADMLPAAKEFLARGFGVLAFDYRGFGPHASAAAVDSLRYIVFNSQWVDDMEGALRYARRRGSAQVFAWGQDLGSVVALAAAARGRGRCDAVAVEGLFGTAQEALMANGTSVLRDVELRHRRLVRRGDEAISAVARLRSPLFVVLAGRDEVTPAAATRTILARAASLDVVWELPEAGHAGAEATPGYFDRLAAWFKGRADAPPMRLRG